LVPLIPGPYASENEVSAEVIAAAFVSAIASTPASSADPLVPPEEIETFSAVRDVAPSAVKGIASPLDLPERHVKLFVAEVIGEPYVPYDWGGEGNDLYSDHVVVAGRRTSAAFLLKGSGTRGRLTVARLGKNGDQIVRLTNSPAELLVVQHVSAVDEAVRAALRDAVISRRQAGPATLGSVWDGTTTARILVAYGLVDNLTGRLTAKGAAVMAGQTGRSARL
jgi:hypothetical protein